MRKVVRVGRLELPASCSQSKRATNCATPGYEISQLWSNMWSTPIFDQLPARWKVLSAQVSQCFPGFPRAVARTRASRSQIDTESFFALFSFVLCAFRSIPFAFRHSLKVLSPYTPHHSVAETVVKNASRLFLAGVLLGKVGRHFLFLTTHIVTPGAKLHKLLLLETAQDLRGSKQK